MAGKTSVSKTIKVDILANAKQATANLANLSKQFEDLKLKEQLEKAAGDQNKLAKIELSRALKNAKDEVKKHTDAQKKAEAQLKKTALATKNAKTQTTGLAGAITSKALVAYAALAMAARKASGAISGIVNAGVKWEGNVGSLYPQVEKLSKATAGLISDYALVRLIEFQKQLAWTDEQTKAVAKAAVEYGRVAKVDFGQALAFVTDNVVSGASRGLKKLGIDMKLNGTLMENQEAILNALARKYSGVTTELGNAGEQTAAYSNSVETLEGRLGQALVTGAAYQSWLKLKVQLIETLNKYLGNSVYAWDNMTTAEKENYAKTVQGMQHKAELYADITSQLYKLRWVIAGLTGMPVPWMLKGADDRAKKDIRLYSEAYTALTKQLKSDQMKQAAEEAFKPISEQMAKTTNKVLADSEAFIAKLGKGGKGGGKGKGKDLTSDEVARFLGLPTEKEIAAYNKNISSRDKKERQYINNQEDKDRKERLAKHKKYIKDTLAAEKKKVDTQKAWHKDQFESAKVMGTVLSDEIVKAAENAKSLGDFMVNLGSAGTKAIRDWAIGKAGQNVALALEAQGFTWGIPNSASINHWAAAAAYTALAAGAGIAGSAMSSSSSSGSSSSAMGSPSTDASSSGYSSSSSSSTGSSSSDSSSGTTIKNETIINLKGRKVLMTRRSLQNEMKKMSQGRWAN